MQQLVYGCNYTGWHSGVLTLFTTLLEQSFCQEYALTKRNERCLYLNERHVMFALHIYRGDCVNSLQDCPEADFFDVLGTTVVLNWFLM
jgi:hypothetical protein